MSDQTCRGQTLSQVLNMCRAFSALGVEVTLALAEPDDKQTGITNLLERDLGGAHGFAVVFYPKLSIGGRLNILGSYAGARRLLKNISADVCFVRDPMFFDLAVRSGMPTIFESHNARLQNRNALLDCLWRSRVLRDMRSSDFLFLVAISQALARVWTERGVPSERTIVLHDGFDGDAFGRAPSQQEARASLGFSGNRKVVVYTGSLYADRGIESILDLARRLPEAQFVAVGGPDDRANELRAGAADEGLGNVQFTGRVPHVTIPTYLAAADVLLMLWSDRVPTINFCSPLKVFEYMSAGRVIVGPGFPTIKEVLTDGETAHLSEVGSIDDLEVKLRKGLAETLPSVMAYRARRLAFERYTWNQRAQHILDTLQRIDHIRPV